MSSPSHISIMDHDDAVRASLAFFFSAIQLRTRSFAKLTAFHTSYCLRPPAIALLEVRLSDKPALAMLGVIRAEWPNMALILMTGDGGYLASATAATAGALAVLEKPFDPYELLPLLARAFERPASSATACANSRAPDICAQAVPSKGSAICRSTS